MNTDKFILEGWQRYHLTLKQQSLIVNTVLGSWVYKEVGWQRYHLLDHSGPAPRQNRPQHQANTILPIGPRLLPSPLKIPKYLSCSYQSYQLVEIFFLTSENTKYTSHSLPFFISRAIFFTIGRGLLRSPKYVSLCVSFWIWDITFKGSFTSSSRI